MLSDIKTYEWIFNAIKDLLKTGLPYFGQSYSSVFYNMEAVIHPKHFLGG